MFIVRNLSTVMYCKWIYSKVVGKNYNNKNIDADVKDSVFNLPTVPNGQEEDMCLISNGHVDLANWFVMKH